MQSVKLTEVKFVKLLPLVAIFFAINFSSCNNRVGKKNFDQLTFKNDLEEMVKRKELDSVSAIDLNIYINHRLINGDSMERLTYEQIRDIMLRKDYL